MNLRFFSMIGALAGIALVSAAAAFGAPLEASYAYAYLPIALVAAATVFVGVPALVYFGGLTRTEVLHAFAVLLRVRDDAFRRRMMVESIG